MSFKAFIAYAREDRTVAMRLADILCEQGIGTFVGERDISLGESIEKRTFSEFSEADMFVMVRSGAAERSSAVQMELGAAWARGMPIVFVIPSDQPNAAEVSLPLDFTAASVLYMDRLSDAALGAAMRDQVAAHHPEQAAP